MLMSTERKVEEIIGDSLEDMGYEVVRIQLKGSDPIIVEVMIDRRDQKPVSMDDCVRVSRESAALLDVADPFLNAY